MSLSVEFSESANDSYPEEDCGDVCGVDKIEVSFNTELEHTAAEVLAF